MSIRRTYKYRIYPSHSQISKLMNTFSMCRHLYNWCLAERIEKYQKDKISIACYDQINCLPSIKAERPWFRSVYAQVLQDVLRRLDKAYQNFFRRIKKSETPGFPKFKKKGEWYSITYPKYNKTPDSKYINVPKIGQIKIRFHRPIHKDAKIKTLSILQESGKWFACFSFELPEVEQKEIKQDIFQPVGIDMGLKSFLYTSEGDYYQCPKYLRKKEKHLQKLQRKLSKKKKQTWEYSKTLKSLQKAHYRVKCQRQDFLHKLSTKLLDKYNLIVKEDLKIQNMIHRPKPVQDESGKYLPNRASSKAGLNKSILDAGWGSFFKMLEYKSFLHGVKIISVNPKNTSQNCSKCGSLVQKTLSIRTHKCPECGYVADRDENAACNILRLGIESLGLSSLDVAAIAVA